MDLGKILQEARLKHNLTQKDVADILDVTINFVSLMERGLSHVPDGRLGDLCEYLGIDKKRLISKLVKEYKKKMEVLCRI